MPSSVLITGCSSGFGLEATAALARRGWRVFASMRDLAKRGRLDRVIKAAGASSPVEVLQLDVTDTASVGAAVGRVMEATGGRLDAVVNNAGVSAGGTFEDMADSEFRRIVETNLFGVLNVTRAVLPAMRERRSGRIVVVTSAGAFFGTPGLSAYAASKWAVEGWAESLALELMPFGLDVICVEPGAYKTEIWDSSPREIPPDSPYAEVAGSVERFVDQRLIPGARDPREVGQAIVRALSAPRPRFRYPVGPDAVVQHLARGKIPNRLVRIGLAKMLGIERAPRDA
jgi:NAD(P)-dependent dehydrogenase (short-subunit alcohol dehydrogenase family)